MTILSQAETIRDETETGANTAARVGECLVDIANELERLGTARSYLSATCINNGTVTNCSDTTSFHKIVTSGGAKTAGGNNFSVPSDNRFQCSDPEAKFYRVAVTASILHSTGSHQVQLGVYSSSAGTIPQYAIAYATLLGANDPVQICKEFVIELTDGDYLEAHLKALESSGNYTVSYLDMMVTEI